VPAIIVHRKRQTLQVMLVLAQVSDSDSLALVDVAEPTAAALSLFRLLLLRGVVGKDDQLLELLAPYQLINRVHSICNAASVVPSDSTLDARRALERLWEVATRVDELCRAVDG